jgi:uncharacterized protein YecT (DUF1311 family)
MRDLVFTLSFVLISAAAQAQRAPDPKDACTDVAQLRIPIVQPNNESDRKFLESCDPADLYYGVMGTPDYAAARRCALYKLQTYHLSSNEEEDIFPTATAAMIYENGQGVPRNPDLALHLFCTYEKPNPQVGYVDQFLAARSTANPNAFDFCALDNEKIVMAVCASMQYHREDNRRLAALRSLMVNWSPAALSSYAAMAKVHDAYVGAATDEAVEACITGTLGEEMEYDDELAKEFEADITTFAQGNPPNFSHADYIAADRDLNAEYKSKMSALQAKANDSCGKIPVSLQTGERAWIRYRDAWVKFAQVQWPRVSADSWLTFLARERTAHVKAVPVE